MRTPILPLLALFALSSPAAAQATTYKLNIPSVVPIDGDFDVCFQGPAGSLELLLVSLGPGNLPTKFGTVGVSFPFLVMIPFEMPLAGSMCIRAIAHCDRVYPGLTLWMQFLSAGPGPQKGISNATSMAFSEAGMCLPGEFITFSQEAYAAPCPGNNVACLLQNSFAAAFPNGLVLGDQDGVDGGGDGQYAVVLTSASAVQSFAPHASSQQGFDADAVNPVNSAAGELAGQLAIAKINVGLDDAGALQVVKPVPTGASCGDLIFLQGCHPLLVGKTVRQVIALADAAVAQALPMPTDYDSNGQADLTFGDLNHALANFNKNYIDGNGNNLCLGKAFGP